VVGGMPVFKKVLIKGVYTNDIKKKEYAALLKKINKLLGFFRLNS